MELFKKLNRIKEGNEYLIILVPTYYKVKLIIVRLLQTYE